MMKVLLLLLVAVLLLSACGNKEPDAEPDVEIDYNEFIDPVVDCKITDFITEEEIVAQLGYAVSVTSSYTDSSVTYQSADGAHILTLTLENMTREDFDAVLTDSAVVWTTVEGLDGAYWNEDHTELIAHQDGYAYSMSVQRIADAAMISITQTVLQNLRG